jgi:predicted phage terminase large subunit-like protein
VSFFYATKASMTTNTTRQKLEDASMTLYELKRRKMKEDFYYFFTQVWYVLEPNNKMEENWHIKYLCYIAEMVAKDIGENRPHRHAQILINICPRSLKSLIFNVALPIYTWLLNPSIPIISNSYSSTLGEGFARKRNTFMNSRLFQSLYGDRIKINRSEGGRDTVMETENTERGVIFVSSTEGTIVGKGLLLGVNDDPTKSSEALQPKALETSIRFYNESMWTRRNNPSVAVIITIMQRLAQGDLSGYLIDNFSDDEEALLHINLPLIADGTEKIPYKQEFIKRYPEEKHNIYKNGYFFTGRFDTKFIRDIKKRGEIFYNTQYLQNPLPSDGIIFKREWFEIIPYKEFLDLKRKNNLRSTHIADTAYTKNTINDPSGLLTYYNHDGTTYITDFITAHIDSAKLPQWLEEQSIRAGYTDRSVITVEPKGSGKTVVSLAKTTTKSNIIEYKYPSSAKVNINMSKEERAHAITSMVEAGKVVIVEGTWNEKFISQVVTFPLAKNDEAVDTLVMAVLRSHYVDSRYKKFGLRKAN